MTTLDVGMKSNANQPLDDVNQDQASAIQKYEDLLGQWWPEIFGYCKRQGLNYDDAQDVTSKTLFEFYQDLQKSKFEERSDKETRSYLYRKAEMRTKDHWRNKKRHKHVVGWQRELSDGQIVDVEPEDIEAQIAADDWAQRTYVVEIAEQCKQERLINEKQYELVRRRMLQLPLPEGWTNNWINTNWHRVKTIIEEKALNDLDVLSR